MEELKKEFNVGFKATINPVYNRLSRRKERADSIVEKQKLHKQLLSTPSKLQIDPNFKRIEFVRYADDWIIGVRGSLDDCKQLVSKLEAFISKELGLVLSKEKTQITNANCELAKFLSVNVGRKVHRTFTNNNGVIRRNVNNLRLAAPMQSIIKKLTVNGFLKENTPYPKFI